MVSQTAPEQLYHISSSMNRASISAVGLDPSRAVGARRAVYAVPARKVVWALAHCSLRHNLKISELDIWLIDETQQFVASGYAIWYSTSPVGAFLTFAPEVLVACELFT